MFNLKYKYKCPYCGYQSNSKRYIEMRDCPMKPYFLKLLNKHCKAVPNY